MDGGRVLEGVEGPAFAGHAISNVVGVGAFVLRRRRRGGVGGEGDDADERFTEHGKVGAELGPLAQGTLKALSGRENLDAGGGIAFFTKGHHAGPAGCDERARAGPRDAGRSVDPSGPVRGDEVLVMAERLVTVEQGRGTLGGEAIFVCVDTDAGDALDGEVERDFAREAGTGEKGEEERTETGVDMERDVTVEGNARKSRNRVNGTMREGWSRGDEEDGVAVQVPAYRGNVEGEVGGRTGD